jgi:redox-regulated HSP33 family molecular chaperone
VLAEMAAEEIEQASKGGSIEVRCEFCGTRYSFDPEQFQPRGS